MPLQPAAIAWAKPVITGIAIASDLTSCIRTTGYAGTATAGIAEQKTPAAAPGVHRGGLSHSLIP